MALLKSISGIRGTIGGQVGENLTPIDIVELTAAFANRVVYPTGKLKVVVGRDARLSGPTITQLVGATLQNLGLEVIDLGLSTTPTIALAVVQEAAGGGIAITASHNPAAWNALKLFNFEGEYLAEDLAHQVFEAAAKPIKNFVVSAQLGSYRQVDDYIKKHIQAILALPLVNKGAIAKRKFNVAIDAVHSTGGLAVPLLLEALEVNYLPLYCTPTGHFPHDPEPLTNHLATLAHVVQKGNYDLGLAVDPDVDRLVILDEVGAAWGEDYTLVAAADYVLQHQPGNTVTNLSASQALRILTQKYGGQYAETKVGEKYVVEKMKATQAVIGGEGNGGVIYPSLHYNRDALVGIALILSHLATGGQTAAQLRKKYPTYVMEKLKFTLPDRLSAAALIEVLKKHYPNHPQQEEEGLKISFPEGWLHLRQSNTEPMVRLYAEGTNLQAVHEIINTCIGHIKATFPFIQPL